MQFIANNNGYIKDNEICKHMLYVLLLIPTVEN